MTTIDWNTLKEHAKAASKQAYIPYSHFSVGAALLLENDTIVQGCNIENASFGLTNCAERTAIFTAVAQGYKNFKAICIYTPTNTISAPCGACRQVLNEFGPTLPVLMCCDTDEEWSTTMDVLLPGAFGPKNIL